MLACVMDGQDGHGIGMSRHVEGRDQVQSGGGARYGGVKGNGHGLICSCFIPDDDDKAATGMFKHQSSSPM